MDLLGKERDIRRELSDTLKLVKEEKNNDVRLALYNYIGNLYSGLSVIKGRCMYPNEKKIFGSLNDFQRFEKNIDFLYDKFNDSFIKNKNFHQDYFNDLLVNLERVFIQKVAGNEYSKENDYFGEKEFLTVFHDFCQSLGLEKEFEELINEKRIFKMRKGNDIDNYLGINLHNPITGKSSILVDKFDYDLDSMFTLAHEFGHYYDLAEFKGREKIADFISYTFESVYQEVVSRLFERLFLDFMTKQKIMPEKVVDKLIDSSIIKHDYLLSSYILSLLDDIFISKDRYLYLKSEEMAKLVGKYFECEDTIGVYIEGTSFDLMTDINYAYGDILSMFLKDEVLNEGFNGELMRKFENIRIQEFSPEFLINEELDSSRYTTLYERELQLIKK